MYDARSKSYVALDEIAKWIDDGQRVRVLDLKSNEDVTIAVLLPLLVERLARSMTTAQAAELHEWIRRASLPPTSAPSPQLEPHSLEDRVAALEKRMNSLDRQR